MKKILVLIILSLSTLWGCMTTAESLSFSKIDTNKTFKKAYTGVKLINSKGEYNRFLMGRALVQKDPLNEMDFDKESLLIIFKGYDLCADCGIELKSVEHTSRKIIVTIRPTQPEENMPGHYYLKIEKTDKKPILKVTR